VGSVTALQLSEAGHDVTVCDNLCTGNAWAVLPDTRFIPADISNEESLNLVLRGGYDAVLHFAGLSLAAASLREPVRYLRANVTGSLNLLHAMRLHGIRRLVCSSSAAIYGQPDEAQVSESAAARPLTPYAASKLAIEEAIGFQAAATDLGAVSLRTFNVAGACGPLGEWHHPESHLVPAALQVGAGVRAAVPVYGTDYDTADGTAIRDYVHVSDVARAHVLALEATTEPGHQVFNIGTGVGHTVRQVVDVARSVTGHPIPTMDAPRREGDAGRLVASTNQARDELGWVPVHSDLHTIIDDAWNWMRAHLGSRLSTDSRATA
jgi:UDP-glucose 4-epimerase